MGTRKGLTLTDFKAANRPSGIPCGVSHFLKTFSVQNQKAVFDALDDPTIQVSAIWRVLRERGFKGSREAVARSRHDCPACDQLRRSIRRK